MQKPRRLRNRRAQARKNPVRKGMKGKHVNDFLNHHEQEGHQLNLLEIRGDGQMQDGDHTIEQRRAGPRDHDPEVLSHQQRENHDPHQEACRSKQHTSAPTQPPAETTTPTPAQPKRQQAVGEQQQRPPQRAHQGCEQQHGQQKAFGTGTTAPAQLQQDQWERQGEAEQGPTHWQVIQRQPDQTGGCGEISPLNQAQSLLTAKPGRLRRHGSTRSIRSTANPTSASRRARVTASAGAAGSAPARRMVMRYGAGG